MTNRRIAVLRAELTKLKRKYGRGVCWICGSVRGMKAGRNSYRFRCARCESRGDSSADVVKADWLKATLGDGQRRSSP